MPKGQGKDWTRPYHVCKGKGCNNWCWASQVPSQPLCSVCGKKWPGAKFFPGPQPPRAPRPQKPESPPRRAREQGQPKGLAKILKDRWSVLDSATQEALQAAGFKPKPVPPPEDTLLSKLLSRKEELPEDLRSLLTAELEQSQATPYEEGQHSSNALTKASHKYRQLARKKLDLQASITQAKDHLKALIEETQEVDKQMDEAKQAIVEAQSKLSEALEQGNPVPEAKPNLGDIAAFENLGKALGIEFTEAQAAVLQKASEAQLPPGLATGRPLFNFGPKAPPEQGDKKADGQSHSAPSADAQKEAPDAEMNEPTLGAQDGLSDGRDRSPRRNSRNGSKEAGQNLGE